MNYRLLHSILFLLCMFTIAEAKITIFARYFGQPWFIKYQYLFFKKNLLDDHEFIVIEDSHNPRISKAIKKECERYNIHYIHIPNSVFENPKLALNDDYVSPSSPSFDCAVSIQYIYDTYVSTSDNICFILDNDIFLLSPLSLENYIGSAAFAYVRDVKGEAPQDVHYMRANFLIFNPPLMPEKDRLDFNLGAIRGTRTDSGGYTHFYLLDYEHLGKTVPYYFLHETPSPLKARFAAHCPLLFTSDCWLSHYFIDKDLFLHIRMGSNWSSNSEYTKMTKEVTLLFDQLLA